MPESYTSLKGFNSVSDVDIQATVQTNLIGFFDWGFLNKGGFTNIRLSDSDIRSSDRSLLKPIKDPNYTDGRVWGAFRQNLVWESGLSTATQPISISGVYVNNVFKTPSASGYQHYVNYVDGTVIFNSPIPTTSRVNMEYSYKHLNVTNLEIVPVLKELQSYSYDINNSNYRAQSGDWSVLSREKIQMPMMSVEVTPRTNFRPYEIGASNQWMEMDVILHLVAEDCNGCMKYSMFSAAQKDKTIWMYNLSQMGASGAMPLDYRGTKTSNPKTYPDLVKLNADGGYRYNKLYLKDVSVVGPNHIGTIYHEAVRFTVETVAIW